MCVCLEMFATKVLPSGSEDPGRPKKQKGDQMSGRGTSNSGPTAETAREIQYNNNM